QVHMVSYVAHADARVCIPRDDEICGIPTDLDVRVAAEEVVHRTKRSRRIRVTAGPRQTITVGLWRPDATDARQVTGVMRGVRITHDRRIGGLLPTVVEPSRVSEVATPFVAHVEASGRHRDRARGLRDRHRRSREGNWDASR